MTENNWELMGHEEPKKNDTMSDNEFVTFMQEGVKNLKNETHYEAPDPERIAQENMSEFIEFVLSINKEVAILMRNSGIFPDFNPEGDKLLLPIKHYVQEKLEADHSPLIENVLQEIMNFIYNVEKLMRENNEFEQMQYFAMARKDIHTIAMKLEETQKALLNQ